MSSGDKHHKQENSEHGGSEYAKKIKDPQTQPCSSEATKKDGKPSSEVPRNGEDENAEAKKPKSAAEKKYGYRLTPEEQELAYELKASMMRKLENQNDNLEVELGAHKNMTSLRRKQQQRPYSCRIATGSGISQHNIKLLMKANEKKLKDAEERIKEMEQELQESRNLARRYHNMYILEKDKSHKSSGKQTDSTTSGRKSSHVPSETSRTEETGNDVKDNNTNNNPQKTTRAKSAHDKKSTKEKDDKISDCALEDDEAVFKRHIARIADTGAMGTTSPIRVQDVIRKSEVLIEENETLKREVTRLKWDNSQLVKKVKQSATDKDQLLHMISTSEAARRDLGKRLERETQKNQKLTKSMTRQTADWIQFRKDLQKVDDRRKMSMLVPMAPGDIDAQQRTFTHPAKKNVYMPRYMYPVEQYSQP